MSLLASPLRDNGKANDGHYDLKRCRPIYATAIKRYIALLKTKILSSKLTAKHNRWINPTVATTALEKNEPVIYAIIFPEGGRRSKTYIGETVEPWRRWCEHIRECGKYVRGERKHGTQPLYKYWAGRGLTSALFIPLRWASMDKPTRKGSETDTIYSFPGTLNTEWIHAGFCGSTRPDKRNRKRHRSDKAAQMEITEQMFTTGELTSGCLDMMLAKLEQGSVVQFTQGARQLTDTKVLCAVYGDTIIRLVKDNMTVEKTLRELKHDILRTDTASQFTLVKLVCNVSRRLALQEDALYNLRKITRDGSAYAAMIRAGVPDKQTMADMVNARALLARIVSPALMEVADRRVAHLCKLTFGIQLPRSLVMKAKIHHNISRGN